MFGRILPGERLVVDSLLPEDGVIFSDGIVADYLAFNSGSVATIRVADRKAQLIVRS